jgi:hypothetical protein
MQTGTIIAAEHDAGVKGKRFCARHALCWWMEVTVDRYETMLMSALVVFFQIAGPFDGDRAYAEIRKSRTSGDASVTST